MKMMMMIQMIAKTVWRILKLPKLPQKQCPDPTLKLKIHQNIMGRKDSLVSVKTLKL